MKRLFFLLLSLCSITLMFTSCEKKHPPALIPLSEAHKKFTKLSQEEYQINAVIKPLKNTMWIYIPISEDIFKVKVSEDGAKKDPRSAKTHALNYIDGQFKNKSFKIAYDISPTRKYGVDPGYNQTSNEKFQKAQRDIITALSRVYIDQDDQAKGNPASEKPPEFFVIVMADIKNGLELRSILYMMDLKRAYSDQTFYEEFAKRFVSEDLEGDTKIIDDKDGNHLDLHEITWPEFLSKQMVHRIKTGHQASSFAVKKTVREEILTIANETIAAYDFKDFRSIDITDLSDQTSQSVLQNDLKNYPEEKSEGKLVTIEFNSEDGVDGNKNDNAVSAP